MLHRGGALLAAAGVAFFGCRAEDKPEAPKTRCPTGDSPLRRLTRSEYSNTIRDLLFDPSRPGDSLPSEEESLGFSNNAYSQVISPVLAERYMLVAEQVSERATQDLVRLLRCDAAREGEAVCIRRFITQFGTRAYRRPLGDADVDALFATWQQARSRGDLRQSVATLMQVMLQSPEFLYRIDRSRYVPFGDGVKKLDGYAVAARLSYLIWGSLPDEELFAAAEAGELETAEQVEQQARRLLRDGRARQTLRDFHAQWLGFSRIDELAKDNTIFPEFDPAIRPHLRAEAERLIDAVLFEGAGDIKTLFTAPYTFINDDLARFYGVAAPGSAIPVRVNLPPSRASGLFTQGGLLSVLAKPNQTSPIQRGKFVREQLLCETIPPPPDNVLLSPPDPNPNLSARDRFAEHRKDPSCGACHKLMDPIGFAFEKYDGLGRYRTLENGRPIDDSGEVSGTSIGAFYGIPALMARLAESPEVHKCVSRQLFRFGQGRPELESDLCTIDGMVERFAESGYRVDELIIALTQTRAFRFIGVQDGGEP